MTMQWSAQQQAVFDWVEGGRGSAVVEAVAGAGKTTTMVQAVRLMGGTVYMGAYNSKMGAELKKRVADVKGVVAGTFHAAGFSAVRRANKNVTLEDKKVKHIVASLLQSYVDADDLRFLDWGQAVCGLVSLAKQTGFYCRGLVPQPAWADWQALIDRHDVMDRLPESARAEDLARLARTALQTSNADRDLIDFDDMCYFPLLLDLRMFQNDWVLIDEAQDTNAVRRALAAKMLRPNGRLLAVGDPHQAIFGFTGADGDSLERIKERFDAITLELSVTYRCPKKIVRVAREYVSHITSAPTSEDGSVGSVEYAEIAGLVNPGDAVLCRYNAPLISLCFKLIRAGKPAKMEGRAIGEGLAALAGRWKVKTLDALETKLDRHFEREIEKAKTKDDEAKIERLQDTAETMRVLILRAREQKMTTVVALQEMVKSMFDDVGASPRLVVLSSVHRSKGLEWGRVFILGRAELMPSKRAVQPWQQAQELNLCYVAVTRAMHTLIDVAMPVKEEGE